MNINFCCLVAILMPVLVYSRALNKDVVSKAINKCCPAEHKSCCVERVLGDSFLPCKADMKDWEKTAVCLEREFHNTSLIESNGMDCCWLLYNEQCREQCSKFMRTPTMSIEEKVMFDHPCMNKFEKEIKDSCLEDSWKRLHLCFPQCIALTTLKSKQQQKFVFDPREHCSFFKQKDSRKPCIGPSV